ncbi:MAG: PadR family transcriptional regulator [Myxococcota bacterium]
MASQPNRTQVALLGFLSWGPMSGYDLRGVIEGSISNFWSEGFGRIYPMLAELAAAGLATRAESESAGGRPRHVYTITAAGRAALERWLHEPPVDRPPRDERLLKLFFGARTDLEASRRLVRDFRAELEGTLEHYAETRARLEAVAASAPADQRFWLMTLRSGELRAEAQLTWCAEVLAELEGMVEPVPPKKPAAPASRKGKRS